MLHPLLRPARTLQRALPAAVLALLLPGCAEGPDGGSLGGEERFTVAAASSLAGVAQELLHGWEAAGEPAPRLTLGASSTLARQLEQGAPFAVFLSADERWIDELTEAGQLEGEGRVELARGRLVVAAWSAASAKASADDSAYDSAYDSAGDRVEDTAERAASRTLGRPLPAGRWTTGDPAFVPLGEYAQEALAARGEWPSLSGRMIPAGSARAALRLVERGEVEWGVLYRSDAAGSADVRILFELGEELHRPIRYCAAVTPRAGEGARRFLEGLAGRASVASFAARGFDPAASRETNR